MKILKYIGILSVSLLLFSCTKETMDKVNEDKNNTTQMTAKNLVPDILLKSAYETTNTDMAWYASVIVEHSAGTWGQMYQMDTRQGISSSTFDNSWNSLYDVMTICHTVLVKTDPVSGPEKDQYFARGVAQAMMAYNLAMATDMWGEVPYIEAFQGLANLKPAYQNQSVLYDTIQNLLDHSIESFALAAANDATDYSALDYIYGGDTDLWTEAAYSLKARFYLRLSERDANAYTKALAAAANGFSSESNEMMFNHYTGDVGGISPWAEHWYVRRALSESQTLENILLARTDPRRTWLRFSKSLGAAPNGTATETQSGYNVSAMSTNYYGFAYATPLMTYHELQFIIAEAKHESGDATWTTSLQDAIQASFDYMQTWYTDRSNAFSQTASDYYTNNVVPRMTTPALELEEILTQKYIADYEFESLVAYNDYRRTGVPTLNNPYNSDAQYGFVNRFPFAYSEVSCNPTHVPECNIFTDKVWWAGGTEKL